MRNRNSNWWWILVLVFFFGGFEVLPLFMMAFIVFVIAMVAKDKNNRTNSYTRTRTTSSRHSYNSRSRSKFSPSQLAKINVYLRKYFEGRASLPVSSSIELRLNGNRYISLSSLDVYRNNSFISSLDEFGNRFPSSYDSILDELAALSNNSVSEPGVVDVEATIHKEPEKKKEAPKKVEKGSTYFMERINSLNSDIPDEEITNGLYETCSLLKQINGLEERFPDSKDKLKKVYDYYLPILEKILVQYRNLQNAKTDPSYEETRLKLTRTVHLINDALKTIISSMTDQDFINLSADIATLEAVLQKDGLTSETNIRNGELK